MFDNNYPYRSSMSKTMLLSFKKFSQYVKKKFKPKLFLEIGETQGEAVKKFFSDLPWCRARLKKDLAGKERFFFVEIE